MQMLLDLLKQFSIMLWASVAIEEIIYVYR